MMRARSLPKLSLHDSVPPWLDEAAWPLESLVPCDTEHRSRLPGRVIPKPGSAFRACNEQILQGGGIGFSPSVRLLRTPTQDFSYGLRSLFESGLFVNPTAGKWLMVRDHAVSKMLHLVKHFN